MDEPPLVNSKRGEKAALSIQHSANQKPIWRTADRREWVDAQAMPIPVSHFETDLMGFVVDATTPAQSNRVENQNQRFLSEVDR